MTATLDGVTNKKPEASDEVEAAKELVRLAREQGLFLDRAGRAADAAY
jgi:hypothetical protein